VLQVSLGQGVAMQTRRRSTVDPTTIEQFAHLAFGSV
jgi:hypothetical protein